MSPINPVPEARRVSSPLERLSFIAPLISIGSTDNEEDRRSSNQTRVAGGVATILGALALGTSMSMVGASIMDPMALSATVTYDLRGSAPRQAHHQHHHHSHKPHHYHTTKHGLSNLQTKSWNNYTQEMVDYIANHAGSRQLSNEIISPLIAATFAHFPAGDHAPLSSLLPNDVNHWADVHWTIAFSQFIDHYDRMGEFGDNETLLLKRFEQYRLNGTDVYNHNKHSLKYAKADADVKYLYHLEMNAFGDMSSQDLASKGYVDNDRTKRTKPDKPVNSDVALASHYNQMSDTWLWNTVPEEFSWKDDGCVQFVKNQRQCGSCWAFSAVESLESAVCVQRKLKSGTLIRKSVGPVSPNDPSDDDYDQDYTVASEMPNLSEQQLVDCAVKDGNHGCHGGMMEFAFAYAMENKFGELCTAESYDYEGKDDVCRETTCDYESDWEVTSWNNVTRFSVSGLQKAIQRIGTIAVSVEADSPMFRLYKGGVVHDGEVGDDESSEEKTCGTHLNHGVAAVGWGVDEDTDEPYWLVKNSWGPQWGEDGFIRLARDSGGMFGECGILMDASFPIVKIN